MKITPRYSEFSEEMIPIDELDNFYHLNNIQIPQNRPYIWVSIISFKLNQKKQKKTKKNKKKQKKTKNLKLKKKKD